MCKTCVVPSSRTRERASNRSSSRRLKGYATDTTTKQKGTDSLDIYYTRERGERGAFSERASLAVSRSNKCGAARSALSLSHVSSGIDDERSRDTRATHSRHAKKKERGGDTFSRDLSNAGILTVFPPRHLAPQRLRRARTLRLGL